MIKFTKMHGIGNDYIYVDARRKKFKNIEELARQMSHRNFGVGSDGLILILNSNAADFKMRIFNADGSEAEMCGNGIRCFAKYLYDHGLAKKKKVRIDTLAGVKEVEIFTRHDKVAKVRVDLGEPILLRERIPMTGDPGMVIDEPLQLNGVKFNITAVSMGNPHAVIYVDDVENFPVQKYGPMIENNPVFPRCAVSPLPRLSPGKGARVKPWPAGPGRPRSPWRAYSPRGPAGALPST